MTRIKVKVYGTVYRQFWFYCFTLGNSQIANSNIYYYTFIKYHCFSVFIMSISYAEKAGYKLQTVDFLYIQLLPSVLLLNSISTHDHINQLSVCFCKIVLLNELR